MDDNTGEEFEAVDYNEDYEEEVPDETAKASLEEKISQLQAQVGQAANGAGAGTSGRDAAGEAEQAAPAAHDGYDPVAQAECDKRSIYVGNVDYTVQSAQLAELFSTCGTVNKVTIPGDANDHPKGYAYIEFAEPEAVEHAMKLTGTSVNGRPINVAQKRTNIQGFNQQARGRGGRGRGRGRVPFGFQPMMVPIPVSPYYPFVAGRGGRGRGRGRGARRGGYAPY